MEIIPALVIVGVATAIILSLGRFAERSPFSVSNLEYINAQAKYQALLFGVAILVLLAISVVNGANFLLFLGPGNITAPAKGVSRLGISEGESWLSLGTSLSFFITLATTTFVYLPLRKSGVSLKRLLPHLQWVLLFSLTNSFSEEVVYRLGVIVPLAGSVDTAYILLISAAAFGAPHLRGMPNGIVGALMAGLLGWLLAKSVVETNGIFWAWFIHALQDIVIFSAFVMAAANKSFNRTSGTLRAPSAG
jgi:uncharacterized protein